MEASKSKLNEFQSIIVKGKSLGLNMTDISEKFENAILNSKDDIIRIVLLGAFSDGKTSAIAGLLGQVIDNMKIDIDESSDELEIYRPKGLKQGYEIVDTPGLFGTKSKEIDGKEIKYSDITKNYLNQTISEIINRKPRFICIEDLNVSGMMKNRHLSKAVQEQGFFWFRKQLEYKCSDKGIQLIVADRFYPSSKLCSCCGNIKKSLILHCL